jgi:hypothetical protein
MSGGGNNMGDAILGYIGLAAFTGGVLIMAAVQIAKWIL